MEKVRVERLVVVGAPKEWKKLGSVRVSEEGDKDSKQSESAMLKYHEGLKGKADYAVVRDPKVAIGKGWRIEFS
jgi:alpha 1,3-glucosidase